MGSIQETDQNYIMHTYARQGAPLVSGRGATACDENGREYIDFGAGIGVNSLGYCDPDWAEAVAEQARTLQHTSNLYYSRPCAELAALLCETTGTRRAIFCNSGAEANECIIKLARKYSFDKYGAAAGRNKILCLQNSFHGRTVTTLSATGQDVFHNYFFPFTEGFAFAPANDLEAVKAALAAGGFCGVLVEFIQGEGGVLPLEPDFAAGLAALCGERDLLLLADEVQTGIGRTGRLLASEWFGIQPDATSLAKGLGGGLPIGAVIANEKLADVFHPGDHGTTFGGNPVSCAGGLVALHRVADRDFLAEVRRKGEKLRAAIAAMPEAAGVDGLGMMLGIRLKTKAAGDVVAACREAGLLVLSAKTKVRLLPPLTITDEELDRGLAILAKALA